MWRTRSLMLLAASPTRSRSALILMTLRMKRRSTAMGCSMASRVERGLIDVALHAVDGDLAAADQVADRQVADAIGLNGALDGLLGKAGHDQEVLLQIFQALLKANPCHPNLPVM